MCQKWPDIESTHPAKYATAIACFAKNDYFYGRKTEAEKSSTNGKEKIFTKGI